MFVNPNTQFLVNKLVISPQLSRAILGLQCGSIQNKTDCKSLLNFLQDGAENDEIQPKKCALSKDFGRLRYIVIYTMSAIRLSLSICITIIVISIIVTTLIMARKTPDKLGSLAEAG